MKTYGKIGTLEKIRKKISSFFRKGYIVANNSFSKRCLKGVFYD